MSKKGFTLLELLIVIAILAILAAAAVVVLNPAELLRRARDTERITDISNVRNAINLYLTTVSSPDLHNAGTGCIGDGGTRTIFTTVTGIATSSASINSSATAMTAGTGRATDGTGWLPIKLTDTAGGAPLSAMPIDETNTSTTCSGSQGCAYYYSCNTSSSTYEIGANMESNNYANGGDDDVESTDGGNASTWYEVGTEPGLDI